MIPALDLQPDQPPSEADVYQLHELVRFHDRAFVRYAYTALTKRAPTPEELARELDDLRSGRRDKVDIIENLLDGKERTSTVRVVGLRGEAWRRASRWPVLGYAWRLLRGLASVPLHLKHQQRFEAYSLGQQQKIEDHLNSVIAPALADSIDAVLMLSESLASLAARQEQLKVTINDDRDQLEAKLNAQQDRLNTQQSQLEASNNTLRRELDERLNAQQELIVQEQQVIVETQKVVMEQLRAEIAMLATAYEQQGAQLLDQLRRLQATVEGVRGSK